MAEINILLIEDLETEIQSFKNSASIINEANNIDIHITNYRNISDSLYKNILEKKYDFIVVDLKLSDWLYWWNDFLKIVKENLHVPIIINSADLTKLDSEFNILNNPLVIQFNANESTTNDILNYILEIYKTWLTKVLWKDWEIEKVLNKLIWDWWLNNIKEWNKFWDEDLSKKSLSRYILSHLHNDLSWESKDFHPEEIYLNNIWSISFVTWTILKKENDYFIILNPACDIAQCNVDYYLICSIDNFNIEDITKIQTKKLAGWDISWLVKSLRKSSAEYIKFLPKSNIFQWWYINFRKLHKISEREIWNFEKICNISPFFLKDIVADFWSYYSRQGQPDINEYLLNNSF